MESIEDERTRSAVTYSMITAIQERCRLAEAPDGMTDNQLMTQVKKGMCTVNSDFGLECVQILGPCDTFYGVSAH